jgi:hypothetical protein
MKEYTESEVEFHGSRPFYPQKASQCPFIRRLVGHQNWSEHFAE